MRIFPGGYRKSDYDKQQDKMATKHAMRVASKHRAELKAIDEAAEQREVAAKLDEAWKKFEAEKAKDAPKPKKRQRKMTNKAA